MIVGRLPSARNGPQPVEVNIKMLRRIVAPSRLPAAAALRGNKPAALGPRARFLSEGPPIPRQTRTPAPPATRLTRFSIWPVKEPYCTLLLVLACWRATYAYKYRWSKQAVLEDILQTFEAGGKPGWQERYPADVNKGMIDRSVLVKELQEVVELGTASTC